MSNYIAGHNAEKRGAEYLKMRDFRIIALNWKTRYCEIDIVAEKGKVMYFVEVKYRRTSRQGFGYEYVTPKKLRQMHFAAEMWVSSHDWNGEYQLAVISFDADEATFIDRIDA
jgi:Holliday junction resolvase-like predicted endonuclease